MKNRIRLNEAQLHRVIKESVRKILSELDWKTYDSAEEKALEKEINENLSDKEPKKSSDFGEARNKAFNDKFGYEDDDSSYGLTNGLDSSDPMRYVCDKHCDYPYPAGVHRNFLGLTNIETMGKIV